MRRAAGTETRSEARGSDMLRLAAMRTYGPSVWCIVTMIGVVVMGLAMAAEQGIGSKG